MGGELVPKVVVYVRAEDARAIAAITGRDIAEWVREQVADAIVKWHTDKIEEAESTLWRE
jgi:hypothetical protein